MWKFWFYDFFKCFIGAVTAWDMLSEEQMQRHISTGCNDFDTILGGGIHCKEVTEVGKYY